MLSPEIDASGDSRMGRKMTHKLQENDPASDTFLPFKSILQIEKPNTGNGFGVLNSELKNERFLVPIGAKASRAVTLPCMAQPQEFWRLRAEL